MAVDGSSHAIAHDQGGRWAKAPSGWRTANGDTVRSAMGRQETSVSFADRLRARLAAARQASGGRGAGAAGGGLATGSVSGLPYDSMIAAAASANGLDPALLAAVIKAESGFNARAVSPAGAKGLMQLMDGTAASLGVKDPFDPAENIRGGARFLRDLLARYRGDVQLALAAYNAGPGAVDRHGGVPPYAETRAYVAAVTRSWRQMSPATGAADRLGGG